MNAVFKKWLLFLFLLQRKYLRHSLKKYTKKKNQNKLIVIYKGTEWPVLKKDIIQI